MLSSWETAAEEELEGPGAGLGLGLAGPRHSKCKIPFDSFLWTSPEVHSNSPKADQGGEADSDSCWRRPS